jgi:diguanylate cyclase (GGDEF)-like protein
MEEWESRALIHVLKLLRDPFVPEISGDLTEIPVLGEICCDLKVIRETLYSFSRGDLSPEVSAQGIIPGCLKALQAHLRHLIWQVQMVEKGDFSQQVNFPGEFSEAFNSMVLQLDNTLRDLRQKEETLLNLTRNLQNEVTLRNSAVEALQESEHWFRHLANHDSLTGVLNRRSFMERASGELQLAARRSDTPRCIAIMDIDHFKRFNDTYGHASGDETLRHVVKVVSAGLRKHDFLGRYGGEEFVLFLGNADLETALKVTERLRKSLENRPVKLEAGPVPVTSSFGVAPIINSEIPVPRDSANSEGIDFVRIIIDRADRALYKAKRSGRNQVVAYEPGLKVQGHC